MTRRTALATHARPLLAALALLVSTAWAAKLQVPAASHVPNETKAAQRLDLIDTEFSQSRNMFVWCDKDGQLWVGTLDPVTGNILKTTYKLLDTDAITPAEMSITSNGPEWVSTATGDQVVYTKFVGTPASTATARLALVEGSADGLTWTAPTLLSPDLPRNAVYASDTDNDADPHISYVDASNNHYWRKLYDASSEQPVKGMSRTQEAVSVRFARGGDALVYAKRSDTKVKQVFMEKLSKGKLVQVTFDDGDKDLSTVPWMWAAPEFSNKQVLMTTVNENELRFYKGDGKGAWAVVNSIKLPSGSTPVSPEPFVYKGNSYVVFAMKTAPNTYPTAIYIAAVSPKATTKYWKVSEDTDQHMRMDPEIYISTQNGPVIYYTKFNPTLDPNNPHCRDCAEGLFRATSGL